MAENPVLIEITRGDMVESVHRGTYVVIADTGNVLSFSGDIDKLMYPRSSLKPLQAIPLIETGAADHWNLGTPELALTCASHNGENRHVDTVLGWLARIGLSEDSLGCGSQAPSDRESRRQLILQQSEPGRRHHNCSGKHAGFLSTARYLREPSNGYLDIEHPTQIRVKQVVKEMTSENLDTNPVGVDGCGAPIFGVSLRGLGLGMARYGTGFGLSQVRATATSRLYSAMTEQPFMVAGTGRWCTKTMTLTGPRLVVKGGAEGVYCGTVPGNRTGIAVKIDDGGSRAAEAVMGLLLARFADLDSELAAELRNLALPPIFNSNGLKVGTTRVSGDI